ncbi:MAG: tetratricopeptide repeat protein [Bacteroidota bacterium]|nr:tetratricopeptide repeat protein [Bacteroidota bacterium]
MVIKPLILTAFLLINFCFCNAQTKKIDSLNTLINKATSDTARINLYVKEIKLLRNENIDSSIKLNNKILLDAQKIGYYKGEVNLRNNLVTSYCFKGDYKSAEENLNFLKTFIKPSKDSSDFADMYSNYGMMYGMQSKYDTSIQFYEKAIGINERNNNKTALPTNYSNIAIGFQQLANFAQALYYQQRALSLAEANKDEPTQAYTQVNMGITYTLIRDSLKSEQAYRKSIMLAEKHGLKDVELYAYTNLSSLYIGKQNWRDGYEFAMKAASLAGKTGDQGTEAASMAKAAVCLANTNKFAEAEKLSKVAIAKADSSAQPLNIYQGYASMGNILKLQKKYSEAIPFYERAFKSLNEKNGFEADIGDSYKELSECYEQGNNYNKALAAFKKYAEIEDSVRSKDNIQKATELSMNYAFQKKQEVADANQAKKNAETKTRQLLLLGGFVLMLALAGGAWLAFRNKRKANQILEKQKTEIQSTLTQLKTTQAQLIQSEKMASLGELTAGIAHEIQNPLNFVNNFSEVNKELVVELNDEIDKGNYKEVKSIAENIKENEEKINHHGKRADAIVKNMLQHSRSGSSQKEAVDINSLSDEYLRLSYHGLRAKDKSFNADFKTDLDESVGNVNIVTQDIGRVLLNLYNNAFYAVNERRKNSEENLPAGQAVYRPAVSVITRNLNGKIEIIVKDNGGGIPPNVVDRIFQPFFTTKPTGEGTGLGLSLSYDIIKSHGGEIKVESMEGEGTQFIIQLPVG